MSTVAAISDPLHLDYDPNDPRLPQLSKAQFSRLASDLHDKHSIFYTFWQLGHIRFSTQIPTACVQFRNDGADIDFVFNPEFWNSLNEYTRQFIICHECLHVVLKHGLRMKDTINPEAVNIALDIVVNHSLVNRFGFERSKIQNWSQYCWVDTVFPGRNLADDRYAEFYIENIKNSSRIITQQTVDEHGSFGEDSDDGQGQQGQQGKPSNGNDSSGGDMGDKLLKRVDGLLSPDEKKRLKDFLTKGTENSEKGQNKSSELANNASCVDGDGSDPTVDASDASNQSNPFSPAGRGRGNLVWTFPKEGLTPKQKWCSLIKKWTMRNKHIWASSEQWIRVNRRNALLTSDLMVPSDMEHDDADEKQKIQAWFFLDTSGSCISFRERFWRCVDTVPRKFFDLELHSFDTAVYRIDPSKRSMRGGGGTSFSVIEQYIQMKMKERNVRYPEVVIVITDGEGDYVNPEVPKRWNWIMPKGSTETFCHKESFLYDLEAFEG